MAIITSEMIDRVAAALSAARVEKTEHPSDEHRLAHEFMAMLEAVFNEPVQRRSDPEPDLDLPVEAEPVAVPETLPVPVAKEPEPEPVEERSGPDQAFDAAEADKAKAAAAEAEHHE